MMHHLRRGLAVVAVAIPLLLTTACWPGALTNAELRTLRQCESTNNYRAVSSSGRYRGAYQFDVQTWNGLGPDGDPAAATPAEQDLRARLLHAQRGWRPWPKCGRFLADR